MFLSLLILLLNTILNMMMKVFIIGPLSNEPEILKEWEEARRELSLHGYLVFDPIKEYPEIITDPKQKIRALACIFEEMLMCTHIYAILGEFNQEENMLVAAANIYGLEMLPYN